MVFTEEFMNPLFESLEDLEGRIQRLDVHPEGCLMEHSLQTFYAACKESNDIDLLLAALLHDIGKIAGEKGHDKMGANFLKDYLSPKTVWLIENHMRIHRYLDGSMKRVGKIRNLVEHPFFIDLVQLARFDKMGRDPIKNLIKEYDRQTIIQMLDRAVLNRFENNTKKESEKELE